MTRLERIGRQRARRRQSWVRRRAAPSRRRGRRCARSRPRPGSRAAPAHRRPAARASTFAGSANTTWFITLATQRYSPLAKSSRARAITAAAPPMYSTVLARRRHRRQRIEIGRIGVVPAEISLIDRLGVVAERAVIAARRPFAAARLGGRCERLGDLGRPSALVQQPQRLVVDELVEVALLLRDSRRTRRLPQTGQ